MNIIFFTSCYEIGHTTQATEHALSLAKIKVAIFCCQALFLPDN
jgi:hypothetical protein